MKPTQTRAELFQTGWCQACERYSKGERLEEIRANPTDGVQTHSKKARYAVLMGAWSALDVIKTGDTDGGRAEASYFDQSQSEIDGMIRLALESSRR